MLRTVANRKHQSFFICKKILFFHTLKYFFLFPTSFLFGLLGYAYIVPDRILAFCFLLFLEDLDTFRGFLLKPFLASFFNNI